MIKGHKIICMKIQNTMHQTDRFVLEYYSDPFLREETIARKREGGGQGQGQGQGEGEGEGEGERGREGERERVRER